jgi:hypothetical protein
MSVIIKAFFTKAGIPQTGLSPTMSIWKIDGTQVITDAAMIEIASGFYYYDFTTYDNSEDYVYLADGTTALPDSERYSEGSNEQKEVRDLLKIQSNNYEIINKQFVVYDDDGVTPLFTWDLFDRNGNPSDQTIFKRTTA